jgi:hypothetical protein
MLGLGRMQIGPRPDAVVIRLMIEATQAFSRRGDIADQDRQRPRQLPTGVGAQNALQRDDAAIFVAVQQYRNEEWRLASSGQMDQGRTGQQAMQFTGRCFEETVGQGFKYGQHEVVLISATRAPARDGVDAQDNRR